jgi:hypothetical protein
VLGVLEHFDQLVAEDDLARRGRSVLAEHESLRSTWAGQPSLRIAPPEVPRPDDAETAGLEEALHCFGFVRKKFVGEIVSATICVADSAFAAGSLELRRAPTRA